MVLLGVVLLGTGAGLALALAAMGPPREHEEARRLIEGGTIRRA